MGGTNDLTKLASDSLSGQIDQLCDEFEARWRNDETPQIEDYLAQFTGAARLELFDELIGIELYWRVRRCEEPDLNDYIPRFPEYAELLGHQFSTFHGHEAETILGSLSSQPLPDGLIPRRFGDYDLLEEIGRGGMGVVYRAKQLNADRTVALKVIRRDWIDDISEEKRATSLERFRHESKAGASLQHDNIVTVYDVGDVQGRPYFSMQYVPGHSLAQIVIDGPLENRRAAAYLEPVARAVEEAHQRGILHRDLKPQNILVDVHTDRPMVTDFGLAKIAERKTEMTRTGEIVGTPSHMSPEQARDSSQVTKQTDVYGLGATLYHLLTARPPFQAASAVETLQQVIKQEPVPPRQLNASIDRDLETIALKCLQKEVFQRYESAGELADDLKRFLNGQPIRARRIGVIGRSLRWSRRNPAIATMVGATLFFACVAIGSLVVGYFETSRALQETKQAEEKYQEKFRDARRVVNNLCTRVSEDTLLNQPGLQRPRRELLLEALGYYEKFVKQQDDDDPTLREELATAHYLLGVITEDIESTEVALESYLKASQLQLQLVDESPSDTERVEALGNSANRIGRARYKLRQFDQAVKAFDDAIAARTKLRKLAPERVEFGRQLANCYMNKGLVELEQDQYERAIVQFERGQEMRRELLAKEPENDLVRRDLAMGHFNSGKLAILVSADEMARSELEKAIGPLNDLVSQNGSDQRQRLNLATCYRVLADLESEHEQYHIAMPYYKDAQLHLSYLVQTNPDVVDYQSVLAGLHMNLAQAFQEQGEANSASQALKNAVQLLVPLVKNSPEVPHFRRDLTVAKYRLALLHLDSGDTQGALHLLTDSKTHLDWLVEKFPKEPEYLAIRDEVVTTVKRIQSSSTPTE